MHNPSYEQIQTNPDETANPGTHCVIVLIIDYRQKGYKIRISR